MSYVFIGLIVVPYLVFFGFLLHAIFIKGAR